MPWADSRSTTSSCGAAGESLTVGQQLDVVDLESAHGMSIGSAHQRGGAEDEREILHVVQAFGRLDALCGFPGWPHEGIQIAYAHHRGVLHRVYRSIGEREETLATLGPGDVFGEMALFAR